LTAPEAVRPLRTEDFDYQLPLELIAQRPAEPRDASRLLVLNRSTGEVTHSCFSDLLTFLRSGDLLVANRTRVIPARLAGERVSSGGRVEALLLRRLEPGCWEALIRPGRRIRLGDTVAFGCGNGAVQVVIGARLPGGRRVLRLLDADDALLLAIGGLPLPPYIKRWQGDPERYQTIYADRPGSAAAPTAGLHFTPDLLRRLRDHGVELHHLTLHVGSDTFRPIRSESLAEHQMHAEWAEVPATVLDAIADTRRRGGRVIAVGTTSVRALESAALRRAPSGGWTGWTELFIKPGFRFRYVDALLTNFHLPRSTLLVLVSAFAGRESILAAYQEAVRHRYRFYSFGDAMLLY
jgi:S-adenosylmethionine:tRNA ribosyltransferase-isomerase